MKTRSSGQRYYFSTRDLVVVAVLSALGGVMSSYIGYLGNLLNRALGVPFGAGQFMAGLHVFWFLLVLGITGKPGSATLAGLLKGVAEVLTGSTHGLVIVLVSGVEGLLVDAAWSVLPKKMPLLRSCLAGGVGAMSNVVVFQVLFFSGAGLGYIALMCALALASGYLLGGYLAYSVLEALQGTRIMAARPLPAVGRAARQVRTVTAVLLMVALAGGALYYYTQVYQPPWSGPACVFEGEVERPFTFHMGAHADQVVTVTAELKGKVTYVPPRDYTGVPLRLLLPQARPRAGATVVRVVAQDGYEVEFSLADVLVDKEMLLIQEGDSLRLVAPRYEGGYWVQKVARVIIE
ncbi:MAG TPA: hypothetical protein GX513_00995 [Firmicutes bacterium]|nr:hypothetical protein [Bacillota bacterium]